MPSRWLLLDIVGKAIVCVMVAMCSTAFAQTPVCSNDVPATCGNILNALSYLGAPGVPAQCNAPYQGCANGGQNKDCKSCDGVGEYGLKYQCVEYVRRFYNQAFVADLTAWPAMNAIDFWSEDNVRTMALRGEVFKRFPNGTSFGPPRIGDIVVFRHPRAENTLSGYGHVAIVKGVSGTAVTLIEQNWSSNGSVALNMLRQSDGTYKVSDRTSTSSTGTKTTYVVVGWLRRYCGTDVSIKEIGNGVRATPYSVNDAGQVTGALSLNPNPNTASYYHAFVWSDGLGVLDLGTFAGTSTYSKGAAIRTQAPSTPIMIVGSSENSNNQWRAFVWEQTAGVMRDIETLGGASASATGINTQGHVTGFSATATGLTRPFLWTADAGMTVLGSTDTRFGQAFGINDKDEVVGTMERNNGDGLGQAVLWTASGAAFLGAPIGSLATAVNNQTDVVGWWTDPTSSLNQAFIWNRATGLRQISDANTQVSTANSINNEGRIVGQALRTVGNTIPLNYAFAYIWDPVIGVVDLNALLPPNSGWSLRDAQGLSDTGYVTGTGVLNGNERSFRMCVGGAIP